ncbi:MAG TPA: hypothetical protein VGF99_03450 [Myxococcota bacterium]
MLIAKVRTALQSCTDDFGAEGATRAEADEALVALDNIEQLIATLTAEREKLADVLRLHNEHTSTTDACSGEPGCWCDVHTIARLRADVERLTKERNTECVRTDKARAAQTRAYLVADTLQAEVERLTHRTQSLETERDHLTEQVLEASKEIGTLTKERDGSVTRANLALGIMRGEVDRLSKDRNALHGVLAELTDFLNGGDYLVDDEDLDALWERAVAVLNDEGGA